MVEKQLKTGPPSPLEKVRKFPSTTTVPRATTVSESMEVDERHIFHIYPRTPRGRGTFLSEPTVTIQ